MLYSESKVHFRRKTEELAHVQKARALQDETHAVRMWLAQQGQQNKIIIIPQQELGCAPGI